MVRPTGAYSLLIITGVTGIELQVTSYEGGHSVGKISKQWAGTLREIFTDADYFGITCTFAELHSFNVFFTVALFTICL